MTFYSGYAVSRDIESCGGDFAQHCPWCTLRPPKKPPRTEPADFWSARRRTAISWRPAGLVIKGTVKVNVETALPLPEARKAQELSKTGHSGGKIVLEVLTVARSAAKRSVDSGSNSN